MSACVSLVKAALHTDAGAAKTDDKASRYDDTEIILNGSGESSITPYFPSAEFLL